MAKIRIEQDPTFEVKVDIPRVGKKPVSVPFTFKYLDREALSELGDSDIANLKYLQELIESDERKATAVTAASIDHQCEVLAQIVEAWGFEEELNEESIRKLVGSHPQIPESIITAYRDSYSKVREGN